jgi:hypothetical protein
MRIVRASDLVAFDYCQRAWWYQTQDVASANSDWLEAGRAKHATHGRQIIALGVIRWAGYLLILAGLAVAAAALTALWLG